MIAWFPARSDDAGKLVLRLAVAGIILFHGLFKLTHGVEWIRQPLGDLGLPGILAYGAYLGEVVAPVLILARVLGTARCPARCLRHVHGDRAGLTAAGLRREGDGRRLGDRA
jgi:hypothetical protein